MLTVSFQTKSFTRAVPVLSALFFLLGACAPSSEPVGRLTAGTGQLELGYPHGADIELTWEMSQALEGLAGEPRVFLHLIDGQDNVVRTFDHPLPGAWKIGGSHSYQTPLAQSALAPPLEAGTYRLTAGLYDLEGNRWALETGGPDIAALEYEIAIVIVPAGKTTAPQFFFSSSWLDVEGGTDLQILARRWLSEDGVIRLGGVEESGRLRMLVGIPEGGGQLQAPVLEDGAEEQVLSISTTCGEASTSLSGVGTHAVELPIAVPAASADGTRGCEVLFSANYYLRSQDGDETRTMALEGLSWAPD